MFVKGGVSYIQLAQLDNVAAVDFGFMSCNSEVGCRIRPALRFSCVTVCRRDRQRPPRH